MTWLGFTAPTKPRSNQTSSANPDGVTATNGTHPAAPARLARRIRRRGAVRRHIVLRHRDRLPRSFRHGAHCSAESPGSGSNPTRRAATWSAGGSPQRGCTAVGLTRVPVPVTGPVVPGGRCRVVVVLRAHESVTSTETVRQGSNETTDNARKGLRRYQPGWQTIPIDRANTTPLLEP